MILNFFMGTEMTITNTRKNKIYNWINDMTQVEELQSQVSEVLSYVSNTNLALFYNVIPDEKTKPYGKSNFTVDLQHIGYTFVRSIWNCYDPLTNNPYEDASYLIASPTGFIYDEFLDDMIGLACKYNLEPFVIWNHEHNFSKVYTKSNLDNSYVIKIYRDYLEANEVMGLMKFTGASYRSLARSSIIDPAWGPKTRVYCTDHNRNDVFGMYPNKPKYDTPLNWEPTPWMP